MTDGSTAVSQKPIRWAAYRGLKAILMVPVLVLFPATAATQSFPGGARPDIQAFSQDSNGPERPGQALELTMLSREHSRRPLADYSVSPVMRYQLNIAYTIAISVLRKEPGCRALFLPLGTNGEAVLASTQYYDAGNNHNCQEGVPAFTTVRSTKIKLFRSFSYLQPSSAAVLLLHEALHSSGLRESPAYPNALTAKEITSVVSQGCNLQ
jgi:hypothetical protein